MILRKNSSTWLELSSENDFLGLIALPPASRKLAEYR